MLRFFVASLTVALVLLLGLVALALTDHDSVEGCDAMAALLRNLQAILHS